MIIQYIFLPLYNYPRRDKLQQNVIENMKLQILLWGVLIRVSKLNTQSSTYCGINVEKSILKASTPLATATKTITVEPEPQAEPEQVSISIANFAFSPKTQTISVGDTITWTNADSTGHSVIADEGAFSSSILSTGESFSFTFDTSGTYTYFCGPHPSMKGTVVVE